MTDCTASCEAAPVIDSPAPCEALVAAEPSLEEQTAAIVADRQLRAEQKAELNRQKLLAKAELDGIKDFIQVLKARIKEKRKELRERFGRPAATGARKARKVAKKRGPGRPRKAGKRRGPGRPRKAR